MTAAIDPWLLFMIVVVSGLAVWEGVASLVRRRRRKKIAGNSPKEF